MVFFQPLKAAVLAMLLINFASTAADIEYRHAHEDIGTVRQIYDGKLYPEKGKVDFIDVAVDPNTDGQMARAVFDSGVPQFGVCYGIQLATVAAGGTVGGMVAAGLSGPRRASAGAVRDYTWREVMDQTRRMAAHLKAQGWAPGSKVAILSKNCAWWMMSDLAIWMAGYVSVPLYPTLAPETIRQILTHSEAKALFVGKLDGWEGMKPGVPAGLPCISYPLSPDDAKQAYEGWDAIVARTAPLAGQPATARGRTRSPACAPRPSSTCAPSASPSTTSASSRSAATGSGRWPSRWASTATSEASSGRITVSGSGSSC